MRQRRSFGFLLDDQWDQRAQWQRDLNGGAFSGSAVDVELALELGDALAHAGDSDSEKRISAIAVRGQRHADAVVADGEAYLRRCATDGNLDSASLGVAVHVGEGFLRDAEQRELDFLGKAPEVFGDGEINRDAAALREEANVGTEADGEPGLVHQWRMQERGNGADLADGVAGERAARFCKFAGALIVLGK